MKPALRTLRAARFPFAAPALALLLTGLLALPARSGVVLTGVNKPLDGSGKPTNYTASVDEGKVRLETTGDSKGLFIYRADKNLFWSVDLTNKTYTEMTRKDIDAMAAQMDAAMKQMQEQMKNLPPEQRKMMEEMMPGMSATPAKVTYKKTGAGKVGTMACDKYEMLADGAKRAELCFVEPAKAGLTMADYKTLTDLVKPFEKIARDLSAMFPQPGVGGAPDAIPMKTVMYQGGKPESESEVKEIRKEALAASVFELPKGLKKQALKQGEGIPGAENP